MTKNPLHILHACSLSSDGLVLQDGSIWSHACTVGQYNKGEPFNLDKPALSNMERVFKLGYPSKVPVDYEHASTSNDPEIRKLRAQGDIPKAGEVLELRAIFSAADFTDELKSTAETLTAKAKRPLDDPRNLGLWMRWKPTAKALSKIQAGEYTELSITFDDDWPDKTTGAGQGPTILAVALTMLPFLDDMLPVAASRRQGDPAAGDRAAPHSLEVQMTTRTLTMFAAVAALAAKPVTDEEQAITELTALQPDVSRLRALGAAVAKALGGETDPVKVEAALTTLTVENATFRNAAKAEKELRIKTEVDAAIKEHEDRIVPALVPMLTKSLTAEVEAGKAIKETDTYKALQVMPPHGLTTRAIGGDKGGESIPGGNDQDAQLDRVARELMETDPKIKALSTTDWSGAFDMAVDLAAKKIGYKSEQMKRVAESLTA